jgi:microcystin-dependent protein
MALIDSNTFIEPTAGTALNTARSQFNNSLRSLLSNFRSSSPPAAANIVRSGDASGPDDGTLFHMANNNVNALYISDSTTKKEAVLGGNFTRVGIGNRLENGVVAMMSNVTHYEIGELVATVSADVALAGNARLYLNKSNNQSEADFIDVGIPPTNGSVVNTMIAVGGVTADRVNFAFEDDHGNSGANAQLKISSASNKNAALALGTKDTASNVSLVKLASATGIKAGVNILDQTGKQFAPVAANTVAVSQITGSLTSDVAELIPAGTVVLWTAAAAPSGWLLCDGGDINRTTYAALFAKIGTTYGSGDGATTFDLPNTKDVAIIGRGDNNSLGTSSGTQFNSSKQATTASGSASLSTGTVAVSSGAKDAGSINVLNTVSATGHTHNYTLPSVVLNYIIKT